MPIPNLFIVGAPKCGTTSMYEYLAPHPAVFMSPRKEPHYFASDLQWQWNWSVADLADYLALFDDAKNEKYRGEASTWYLYSPGAAARIKAFSPDARIITMLRNPVDMIRSLHWHSLRNGNEDQFDLDAALEAEPDRRCGRRIPRGVPFVDVLFYRAAPLYAQQLQRFFKAFGRERVLVIIFEDFAQNPQCEYTRVMEFLEISKGFAPDFTIANPGTSRPKIPFPRFLKRHPRLHRMIQAALPLSWRQAAGPSLRRMMPPPPPRPPISREREAELREYFKQEVEALSSMLDRDLTHWCRPDLRTD